MQRTARDCDSCLAAEEGLVRAEVVSMRRAAQVYEAIKEELAAGGRAYIICPLVSEGSAEGMSDIKAGASMLLLLD